MKAVMPSAESTGTGNPSGQSRHIKAYLSLGAATLFWSSNVVAVKLAVQEMPPMATAALRVTLAAVTLLLIYTARGGRLRLRPGEWRTFLRLGLWGLAASFSFFTLGVHRTSVSHAVFVGALTPLTVLLLAWLDGQERISPLRVGALLVSLAGVLLLALDRPPGGAGPNWQGDLLVVGGVACFAFYMVRGKSLAEAYPTLQFNVYLFLAAAAWLFPLLCLELARLPWEHVSWVGWTSLAYSATVGSAGAYLAHYYSLRRIPASRVAVFHYLQPPLGAALGFLFFPEVLTARFLLGAALILTGVVVAEHR